MEYRPDETWHRLLEWTEGSSKSERLASQIVLDSGFTDVDPSHPLGGKDGGKDALCLKDGKSWTVGVYFPRGKKNFAIIRKKFEGDLKGAVAHATDGFVFVTNQELRLAERETLKALCGPTLIEIFHLERISSILDKPTMAGIRAQFLDIDFSNNKLKQAIKDEISESESRITAYQTGGESYCYWMLYDFDLEKDIAQQFVIIKKGDFPLYDLRVRIMDMDGNREILEKRWGEMSAPAEFLTMNWPLNDRVYYRIFFHARNGQWHQDLRLMKSRTANCWLAATRVSDKFGNPHFQHVDDDFEAEFGEPAWLN